MSMPADLFLVRHGESEGNIALKASRKGDNSLIEDKVFAAQHSSKWRLTAKGRAQAETAGERLRENHPEFDFYFTSEFTRCLETAALLNICPENEQRWRINPYVTERG